MAKLCTKATNLLKFCMVGSDGLDLALGAGAVGFEFAASNMYTGSGLYVAWALAVGVLGSDCGAGEASM